MKTNDFILPAVGLIAVTSLSDFQQKCMRNGVSIDSYSGNEVTSPCVACQCCVGCIVENVQENVSDNNNEYKL